MLIKKILMILNILCVIAAYTLVAVLLFNGILHPFAHWFIPKLMGLGFLLLICENRLTYLTQKDEREWQKERQNLSSSTTA